MASSKSLTMPREHGALVTLGGSALLAALVAPLVAAALAAGVMFALAYLARGPIERWVTARPSRTGQQLALRRLDGAALVLYLGGVLAASAYLGSLGARPAVLAALLATSIPIAGVIARATRMQRSVLVEVGGMAVFGAAAGVAAYAGGAGKSLSVLVGVTMAAYAAASTPIVRAEVRRLEADLRRRMQWYGLGLLLVGAALTAALRPPLALAFAPRVVHALYRGSRGLPAPSLRVGLVAARECTELALFVVLVALLA